MRYAFAALASAAAIAALPAQAAPVSFTFDAGPVTFINPDAPAPASGFVLGEDVLVTVTIDDQTPDDDDRAGRGEFADEAGAIVLTGRQSGAVVSLTGVEIQTGTSGVFDVESTSSEPSADELFVLDGDIDYRAPQDFYTDADDLPSVLADLMGLIRADGALGLPNEARTLLATLEFFGGDQQGEVAFRFGPVDAVPLPGALGFMLAGLGGVGALRRRA